MCAENSLDTSESNIMIFFITGLYLPGIIKAVKHKTLYL